jgi:hypothetical protein
LAARLSGDEQAIDHVARVLDARIGDKGVAPPDAKFFAASARQDYFKCPGN